MKVRQKEMESPVSDQSISGDRPIRILIYYDDNVINDE